jgi:glycosyltransferase involved in cell wall biosynthesis
VRRPVFIGWSLSSFTGWGVYGLNLALAWARDPDLQPVCTRLIGAEQLALDPLRQQAFRQVWADSAGFQGQLAQMAGRGVALDAPHLIALGPTFEPTKHTDITTLKGQPDIGVVFTEIAQLAPEAVERARAYPILVAGSTWNAQVLRAHGMADVRTILQGVDTSLFRPGPKNGWLGERFCIFSGGKLELRKGQDIVMAAFRVFAERHPEALLVTAWHSDWPQLAGGTDRSGRAAPMAFKPGGGIDVLGWAEASGVRRDQVLDLGKIPNMALPQVLAEMDLAVFPNRSEGGTNLVAMEAMACGVPTALSANTGHLDLIEDGNSYALTDQQPVSGMGAGFGDVAGWGEVSTESLVEAMERAFADRSDARQRGQRGAAKLAGLSWRETARQMKELVLSTRPA